MICEEGGLTPLLPYGTLGKNQSDSLTLYALCAMIVKLQRQLAAKDRVIQRLLNRNHVAN